MIEILFKILDKLLQLRNSQIKKIQKRYDLLVQPIYEDLEKIHSNYQYIFNEALLNLKHNKTTLDEIIFELENRRIEFEPIRMKLISHLHELIKVKYRESNIDRFIRAVVNYFPTGDISSLGGGTAATSLIRELNSINGNRKSEMSMHPILLWEEIFEDNIMFKEIHNENKPWNHDPIKCIDYFIEIYRFRWKRVCDTIATIKVELAKHSEI